MNTKKLIYLHFKLIVWHLKIHRSFFKYNLQFLGNTWWFFKINYIIIFVNLVRSCKITSRWGNLVVFSTVWEFDFHTQRGDSWSSFLRINWRHYLNISVIKQPPRQALLIVVTWLPILHGLSVSGWCSSMDWVHAIWGSYGSCAWWTIKPDYYVRTVRIQGTYSIRVCVCNWSPIVGSFNEECPRESSFFHFKGALVLFSVALTNHRFPLQVRRAF